MNIQFSKYQGIGNDMIMVDNLDGSVSLSADKIARICDRHFGVGADGLILLESCEDGDCFMNYYNCDGSVVEMCGNGIRCAAAFYLELLGEQRDVVNVGSRAGVKEIRVVGEGLFSVNMGSAEFESDDFPSGEIEVEGMQMICASMGNPHAVSFVENIDEFDLETVGPRVECAEIFPKKINFEIVEQLNEKLKMRVWERDCGITLACGTGACAVYAVAKKLGKVEGRCEVMLPGGSLWIEEDNQQNIWMTGAAEKVFEGKI